MAFTLLPAHDADGSFGHKRLRIGSFEPLLKKHRGIFVGRVPGGAILGEHFAAFQFADRAAAKKFAGDAQALAGVAAPVVRESMDQLDGVLTEAEDRYAKRVNDNMAHMGTRLGEWSAVPFTMVDDPETGRKVPQHDFSSVREYKSAPSLYANGGSTDTACELCGKAPIKNIFHACHHGKQLTMAVGSECIKKIHPDEKSGEDLEKEAIAAHAKETLKRLHGLGHMGAQVYKATRGFGAPPGLISRADAARKLYQTARENVQYDEQNRKPADGSQGREFDAVRWYGQNGKKAEALLEPHKDEDLSAHIETRDHSWMDWKKPVSDSVVQRITSLLDEGAADLEPADGSYYRVVTHHGKTPPAFEQDGMPVHRDGADYGVHGRSVVHVAHSERDAHKWLSVLARDYDMPGDHASIFQVHPDHEKGWHVHPDSDVAYRDSSTPDSSILVAPAGVKSVEATHIKTVPLSSVKPARDELYGDEGPGWRGRTDDSVVQRITSLLDEAAAPHERRVIRLPKGTTLYHGSPADLSNGISFHSRGKFTGEHGLISLTDSKNIASGYGNLYAHTTQRPLKLIGYRAPLTKEQAEIVNNHFDLPDYKRIKAGDSISRAVEFRALDMLNRMAGHPAYPTVPAEHGEGDLHPLYPGILRKLGYDGMHNMGKGTPMNVFLHGQPGERLPVTKVDTAVKEAVEHPSGEHTIKSAHDGSTHPAEMVDGALKHTHNSEGRLIHPTAEGRANFHRWFGDSKVVDEHGRPKVVYHGLEQDRDRKPIPHFTAFRLSRSGAYGPGAYFTSDTDAANTYAGVPTNGHADFTPRASQGSRVMPVYIKATAPYHIRSQSDEARMWEIFHGSDDHAVRASMQKAGHDSIVAHSGVIGTVAGTGHVDVVAFHPHQIKSAIGNNGKFSKDSDHIHENFFDKTKGAWRTKGGKFGSHRTIGGAQWVPHLPKKVKATVESLKGKVKAWSSGGGLAFIFESAEKADLAFDTLRRQGIRVTKHDIPGILYYQGLLGESVDHVAAAPYELGFGTAPLNMLLANSLATVNRINALLAPPKNSIITPPHEDFDDEDEAEAYAVNRAQVENQEWGVLGVGGKFRALPLDDCFEWLEVCDDCYLHAAFNATGGQILDGDDDTDWVHTKPVSESSEKHPSVQVLRSGIPGEEARSMMATRPGREADPVEDKYYEAKGPYALCRVPVDRLHTQHDDTYSPGPFTADIRQPAVADEAGPERVQTIKDYAALPTPFPPVVAVGDKRLTIMDGNHRVMAARLRGDTHIDALIPHKSLGLDEAVVTERHSIASRLGNARARAGLAGGIRKRMRAARRSARNRLRKGFLYQAKSKVRSALHNQSK